MNTTQHYDRADLLLDQAEARLARLREHMATGDLRYDDVPVAVSLVALDFAAAQVHATLATA